MVESSKAANVLCFDARLALEHLRSVDPNLRGVIDQVGPFGMEIRALQNVFEALARNIVYQQLHGRAAARFISGSLIFADKSVSARRIC
ncbi:MAG: hypothetical protein WKF84_17545 [Pyrinomonadaceae bacterium]